MNRFKNPCTAVIGLVENFNRKLNIQHKFSAMTCFVMLMILTSVMLPVFISDSFSRVVLIGGALAACCIGVFINVNEFRSSKIGIGYLLLYLIIGGSFLVNGLIFRVVGYIAIGLVFAVLLPVFYKTMAGCGSDKDVFKSISTGIVIAFCIFFVLSIVFGPSLDLDQYSSFLSNPNTFGGFMAVTAAACLYLLDTSMGKSNKKKIFFMILLGIIVALCFFSNSRTYLLSVIAQFAIYFIRGAVSAFRNKKIKVALIQATAIIVIIAVMFAATFFVLTTVNSAFSGISSKILSVVFDSDDAEGIDKEEISISDSIGVGANRFDKGLNGEGGDAFTSGRLGIWKAYIDDLSFIGHASESKDIVNGDRVYEDTNAHNVYLQVAYSAGIIAGVSMLLLVICIGISLFKKAIIFLIDKNTILTSEVMFMAAGYLVFFISSITSGGYMIFTYLPATLFWLCMFRMVAKNDKF